MIAKFTAQMRPRAQGSQRVTEEHNSFIGASINARTKEFLERSHWQVMTQMRLHAKGSQRETKEHISFIGTSINDRAKEFLERSH